MQFSVGKATVARIEETYLAVYDPKELFPEFTDEIHKEHAHWLAPNHYDPASAKIKLSVHSWLLQIGKQKILIDACCGNNRMRATRPWWSMLNTPWLERLAAAGARPEEIDLVMCTHLHHDHVGWNTQMKDGRWVPTFPNARYVFSKPDVDYFHKADLDPKTAPVEFGTFRECVLPIIEAGRADLVSGQRIGSTIISKSRRRPAIHRVMWCSGSKAAARTRRSSATYFITCCRSITRTGISRKIPMPNRPASAAALCWNIAPRKAHWCSPAMSARRSPAISRPPRRAFSRGLADPDECEVRFSSPSRLRTAALASAMAMCGRLRGTAMRLLMAKRKGTLGAQRAGLPCKFLISHQHSRNRDTFPLPGAPRLRLHSTASAFAGTAR